MVGEVRIAQWAVAANGSLSRPLGVPETRPLYRHPPRRQVCAGARAGRNGVT
jgi:hypothetical protein